MEFDLITLRIHVYRHGSSSLNGSLFRCRKRMKGSHLILTNHSGRERDGDAVISRKASRLIELQGKNVSTDLNGLLSKQSAQ